MRNQDALVADHGEVDVGTSSVTGARHWRREHFIPIRKAELVRVLARDADLPREQREQFLQFSDLVEATVHREYYRRLAGLKDTYAPLNPDAITTELEVPDEDQRAALCERFFAEMVELLERANYQRLTRAEIEDAVGVASHWGVRLNVDFDVFLRPQVTHERLDAITRRTADNSSRAPCRRIP